MKSMTVTAKTALVSSVLSMLFLSIVGVVFISILDSVVKNAAESTLHSEIISLSATIETISPKNSSDALDPLPPGQLAVVKNHSGLVLLNSFQQLSKDPQPTLKSLPFNKLSQFSLGTQKYWGIRTSISGPGGYWEVVVAQNGQLSGLFTHKIIYLLSGFGVALVLVIWFGSLLLSNYVLRPVRRMRTSAEELILNKERGNLPVSTAEDEISRLATTLNQLLTALHESIERQSRLVADVSHELRTPLTVLQSRLQIAISEESRPEKKLELVKILDNSLELTNTLNQILYLSRNTIPASMQCAEPDQISALLSKTVDNLRILASKKGIAIDFAINLTKPVQVAIDGLERVLINLITNAIESTPAHGSITVNFSQNGKGAELSVEDTGTGFDSEFISYAFDRFSRSDVEQIEEKNGFGLGLSLVKVIVDSCEGTVEVANKRVGQGAVVTTWFKNSSGL